MFVLLKHDPPSKVKPYHYENIWRYIERPPRNKCYKLLCVCSDLKEVQEAIRNDVKKMPRSELIAWQKWWYDDED